MKRLITLSLFSLIFVCAAFVESGRAQIVFKVPDDVFPMDWKKSGFNGMLMLRKDSPSGIFIAYPNDGEKIEELRARAAQFIVPMLAGQDKDKKEDFKFQISPVPVHKGDAENSGQYYAYTDGKTAVQILFYDRVANGKPLIYGYFAEKSNSYKDIWADDKGQGIKVFEKFWKSFKD